jgi:hypothetical protein
MSVRLKRAAKALRARYGVNKGATHQLTGVEKMRADQELQRRTGGALRDSAAKTPYGTTWAGYGYTDRNSSAGRISCARELARTK